MSILNTWLADDDSKYQSSSTVRIILCWEGIETEAQISNIKLFKTVRIQKNRNSITNWYESLKKNYKTRVQLQQQKYDVSGIMVEVIVRWLWSSLSRIRWSVYNYSFHLARTTFDSAGYHFLPHQIYIWHIAEPSCTLNSK